MLPILCLLTFPDFPAYAIQSNTEILKNLLDSELYNLSNI